MSKIDPLIRQIAVAGDAARTAGISAFGFAIRLVARGGREAGQ